MEFSESRLLRRPCSRRHRAHPVTRAPPQWLYFAVRVTRHYQRRLLNRQLFRELFLDSLFSYSQILARTLANVDAKAAVVVVMVMTAIPVARRDDAEISMMMVMMVV